MNFRNANSRQPEIIRAVQKDHYYTTELSEDFSDILKLTGQRNWIKYNNLCRLLGEISYHGFSSLNSLQTLGEEYTGIIQVDRTYVSLPHKLLQLIAIILEFGGDALYLYLLKKLEKEIESNDELRADARKKLQSVINFMRCAVPYVKALHKTIFYFRAGKYQISKRITGINYVLIRHWLTPDHSLYGYRILGIVTFLQLTISLLVNMKDIFSKSSREKSFQSQQSSQNNSKFSTNVKEKSAPPCNLCLDPRQNTSITPCGHLFCWMCIMEWLNDREECPVCRESIKKSNIIQLLNYS